MGYVWSWGAIVPEENHECTYEISPSTCLSIGYHLNSMDVFAVNTNYLTGNDIDNLDLPNDSQALISNLDINPYAGYFNDSIPIEAINEFYKVMGFTETSVVLHMWKEIIKFNDGSADSVKTYEYVGDTSLLSQEAPSGLPINTLSSVDIILYPNPTDKFVFTNISNSFVGEVEIKLFSSEGNLLFTSMIMKNTAEISARIPFEDYVPGIYFIHFKFGDVIETKRFIVNKN